MDNVNDLLDNGFLFCVIDRKIFLGFDILLKQDYLRQFCFQTAWVSFFSFFVVRFCLLFHELF